MVSYRHSSWRSLHVFCFQLAMKRLPFKQALATVLCLAPHCFAEAPALSGPTNIFAPVSTPADWIYGVSLLVLVVTGCIFAIVFGLLAYVAVKFRRRTEDDGGEPAQVYGSIQVEIAWTVIPILIVVVSSRYLLVGRDNHCAGMA
jgi:heme/copper-type cytochrome/quinol oxidase subunit 2